MYVMSSVRDEPFRVWVWGLLYLVCLCFCVGWASGFPFDIPLVAEELPDIERDKPGCYMDRKHYAYGEMWNPVLVPQGIMVCIRCQCLPVENKGVAMTLGRTICRNIKELCPVPACPNPVLRPGKCCKSCPGDDFEDKFSFHPDVFVNDAYSQEDQAPADPDTKDFQALLVGQHVPTGPVPTRGLAAIRLTLEGPNTVHYALRYTHLDRPKYLRIVHVNGNVLFKTPIVKQVTGHKKVCGEWESPVPEYMDYIREGKAVVVIGTSKSPAGVVAGRIRAAPDNNDETFNSLLTDKSSRGGGAMASLSYSPKSRIVTYEIITSDVAVKGRRGIFTVSIMKGPKVIYKTKGTAMSKTTKLSGRWKVYKRSHRRRLGRGLLRMRVKFSDGHMLIGNIQTKLSCNAFQAVLSGSQAKGKRRTYSGGSAVVRMGDDAKMHYAVRLENMVSMVTKIRLEGRRRRKKNKMKSYGSFTTSFVRDGNNTFNGWANGTLKGLEPDVIHGLLSNQLFVSVSVSGRTGRELRGRLVDGGPRNPRHYRDASTTLVPATREARGGAGLVWLWVDSRCRLHFDAMAARSPGSSTKSFEVFLAQNGDDAATKGDNLLWLPIKRLPEKRFGYVYVRGQVSSLSNDVMRDLDQGRMFVQMRASKNNQQIYRANITVSNSCWMAPNDAHRLLSEDNRLLPGGPANQPKMCRFEGQTYQEGTAWIPDVDEACTTCSCARGKTVCQKMMCPVLSCSHPVQVVGRCCPSCPHEDPSEMCQLGEDPREYPLHSVWHPYLPTYGFSSCAMCTCLPGKKVKCFKQPCPAPPCPRSDWVKKDNNSCCYTCRDNSTVTIEDDDVIPQPQSDIAMVGVCIVNGEIRHDEERWHPTVHPFGYMKCFSCLCQNGTFTCGREQCPVLTCANKIKRPNQCCEECAADQDLARTLEDIPGSSSKGPLLGCRFADTWYREGERWKPPQWDNPSNSSCIVCKCKAGNIDCRPRCPKECKEDPVKNPCCHLCTNKKPRRKQPQQQHGSKVKKRKKSKSRGYITTERKNNRRIGKNNDRTSRGTAPIVDDEKQAVTNLGNASIDLMSLLRHD